VTPERPAPVAVGVREHLVRETDRQVVFAGQREEVGDLAGHVAEGLALLLSGAFQPVESRRAVEDDQVEFGGQVGGVLDGLLLLFVVQRVGR